MKSKEPPEPVDPVLPVTDVDVDAWGLPSEVPPVWVEAADPELGYCTGDDPDDPY